MLEKISERLHILKINTINSYLAQTAYFFENIASVGSTTFYTVSTLIFLKVIYSNVNSFAGYTENEMLLILFLAQVNFYTDNIWSRNNVQGLIENVRTGHLDLILVKPIPSLFFITFNNISLINRLKDGLVNVIILAIVVNWSEFHTSLWLVIAGILIFIFGQIAWHCFTFLFALPVFFLGQSNQVFHIGNTFAQTNNIPYEGFGTKLRFAFTTFVPNLIAVQMTVSVILGKSNPLFMILFSFSVAVVFLLLKHIGWIISLRNYSSASS